jgi:hypothetical protein
LIAPEPEGRSVGRARAPVAGLLAFVLVLGIGTSGMAQSVDLISSELDGVRRGFFRLGAFYVTPALNFSSGYDSNALSTSLAESDVTARIGPGVRLAVPLGETAFFDVDQEVDYVYYKEQLDLRRFYDVTRVGAGIGSRRLLFKVADGFRDETGRPTTEFDFPVRQRSNQLDGTLDVALGWRHTLRLGYTETRFKILEGAADPLVSQRLNRVQNRGFVDLRRKVTAKTSAIAEGFYERFQFDDVSRDGDSYGGRFGFEFSPGGGDPLAAPVAVGPFVSGRFLLGFRTLTPFDTSRVGYTGLIGSVDVTVGFGEAQRVHGLYSRDIVPSIFDDNWFFVENRYGASFSYQMTDRVSVTPGVVIGRNRYPLPATVDSPGGAPVVEEIYDRHTDFQFAFDIRVTERWTVGLATDYLKRDSNVFAFAKDRLQAGFTMSFRP